MILHKEDVRGAVPPSQCKAGTEPAPQQLLCSLCAHGCTQAQTMLTTNACLQDEFLLGGRHLNLGTDVAFPFVIISSQNRGPLKIVKKRSESKNQKYDVKGTYWNPLHCWGGTIKRAVSQLQVRPFLKTNTSVKPQDGEIGKLCKSFFAKQVSAQQSGAALVPITQTACLVREMLRLGSIPGSDLGMALKCRR